MKYTIRFVFARIFYYAEQLKIDFLAGTFPLSLLKDASYLDAYNALPIPCVFLSVSSFLEVFGGLHHSFESFENALFGRLGHQMNTCVFKYHSAGSQGQPGICLYHTLQLLIREFA